MAVSSYGNPYAANPYGSPNVNRYGGYEAPVPGQVSLNGGGWGSVDTLDGYMKKTSDNRMQADAYSDFRQSDLGQRQGLTALSATSGPDGRQTVQFGRDPMADLDSSLGIRDKYNAAAESRYMSSINGVTNQSPSGGVQRNSGPIRDAEQASESAAFGRAKDRAGLVARGSLDSAQDVLAGRGLLGSGLESKAYQDVIGKGATDLTDVVRQQAVDSVDRAERRADTEYGGAITQRGQNMQQAQSMLSLIRRGGALY